MIELLSNLFICLLVSVLMLNVFGIPGNWFVLGLIFLWQTIFAPAAFDCWFWIIIISLGILGEVIEFAVQILKARKYGSSSHGVFAGMVGAILGALLLAPIFWGIGALLGAVGGAWIACFFIELAKGKPLTSAREAAFGAMIGRLLGTVCKFGVGGAIVAVTANRIFNGSEQNIEIVAIIN